MSWYVINTHPKKEFLALANISRQGFHTFCPTFIHTYPKIGDRIRPLFPSYVFVEFDAEYDRWYPLCHTIGVKRLFSTYPDMAKGDKYAGYLRPTPIDSALIMTLQQQSTVKPNTPAVSVIQPGTTVKVMRGHFEGKEGICSWSNQKRVALLIDVLNGKLEISFARDNVELVE